MWYRSVTGGAERLRHALFCPGEDVAAGSHRPSDQNRLTCELKQQERNRRFKMSDSVATRRGVESSSSSWWRFTW